MTLSRTRLRAVQTLDDAVGLFAELGYTTVARPLDLAAVSIPGVDRAVAARSDRVRRRGYALVIGETETLARSLRPLGKALHDQFHDHPLGVVGVLGTGGQWERMVVVRPRVTSRKGGITVARLEIDLRQPTQHDAQVLAQLAWQAGDDTSAQRRIDAAFNVRAVTDRFFRGLAHHYGRLVEAVRQAMDADLAVADRLKGIGDDPAERTALRVLTQILFVQFLQKKGTLEGQRDWLTRSFRAKTGPYYQSVLERLFYAGFGKPKADRQPTDPDVPFLDGGLFERFYGPISLPLPDELFDPEEGLLGYLDRWTFTVHEDMPDEEEVAVDPEMLGNVFEHLAGKAKVEEHGTVYTPRAVVHFMCREALVPWLEEKVSVSGEDARILLTEPAPFEILSKRLDQTSLRRLAADVPQALDGLLVIDPAVGSGAFLLGMLSEIVRLRTVCHHALNQGTDPGADQVTAWKEQAVSHTLFGVDIEARAIELCRLRLWLSLLVDLPLGVEPQPLPNLEYRTVVADSLVDFVNGVEIQNSRGGLSFFAQPALADLHRHWFHASGASKEQLQTAIRQIEDTFVHSQLEDARNQAKDEETERMIDEIETRFVSATREFPCFVPALHAPDVAGRGGWDVVIMNPPYVGKKEVAQRLPQAKQDDLDRHFGWTNDLMIHFAYRAFQLVRPGGVVSMIFNDSIFTSADANDLRRRWADQETTVAIARTKCFEGRAINGGVVVVRHSSSDDGTVRWLENHGRPVEDLSDASSAAAISASRSKKVDVGTSEAWATPISDYRVLPHRPLYRPSAEALTVLDRFKQVKNWNGPKGWADWDERSRYGWPLLSNTRALRNHVEYLRTVGFFDMLKPGDWVLLGLVIEGGQGLATADDRRFLAAIEGTAEAETHLRRQEEYVRLVMGQHEAAALFPVGENEALREAALIAAWDRLHDRLGWPRSGIFRIAAPNQIRNSSLSDDERKNGISSGPYFIPFEKGDESDEEGGRGIGARWERDNPLVIDWSLESVALLRERARLGGSRSPRFQNEGLWFQGGVTWNRVASYLRCRLVPEGSIFSDKTPTVHPTVDWLTVPGILALLNADVVDFIVRTFLGSRMQLEIGDIRRVPIPVLDEDQSKKLDLLGAEATAVKRANQSSRLLDIEAEVNGFVGDLYGIDPNADLWVVR